jgi:hypothetical protein
MEDIAACAGHDDEKLCGTCRRRDISQLSLSQYQTHMSVPPTIKDGKCEHYWDNISHLKSLVIKSKRKRRKHGS